MKKKKESSFWSWTIGEQAVPVASQWQYYKVSLEVSPGSALTCRAAGHAAQLTGLFACPRWSFSKGPQWQSHSGPGAINDRVQQHIKRHILRNLHRLWSTARMPGTKGECADTNQSLFYGSNKKRSLITYRTKFRGLGFRNKVTEHILLTVR